jgi:hypothetical protein
MRTERVFTATQFGVAPSDREGELDADTTVGDNSNVGGS